MGERLGTPGAGGMGLDINAAKRWMVCIETEKKYVMKLSISGKASPSDTTNSTIEQLILTSYPLPDDKSLSLRS